MNNIDGFFAYARARYQLMLDKEADFERPWTNDEILQTYRFCNVFREDDTTTKWIANNIREPLRDNPQDLVLALIIARWFNRIETLSLLGGHWGEGHPMSMRSMFDNWNSDEVRRRLTGISPLVTGAYIIKTPAKMNKLEGLIQCIEQCKSFGYPKEATIACGYSASLQTVTDILSKSPYLGPFMAYEVVTDLRHTPLLDKAPDIMTWANPGPGCTRGLSRVYGEPLDSLNRHKPSDVEVMQRRMQKLLKHSQRAAYWPHRFPKWDMRTVEHTLCEFDKYERTRLGEGRPKQKYKPLEEK